MESKILCMEGKAGLCTPRRGPRGQKGGLLHIIAHLQELHPASVFLPPLSLRSLSPSFVHNSEARHPEKKVSPVHGLSAATLQIKVIIMNVCTLEKAPAPFPFLHLAKQSTDPAALQPHLDAESVWDRDRRVSPKAQLIKGISP